MMDDQTMPAGAPMPADGENTGGSDAAPESGNDSSDQSQEADAAGENTGSADAAGGAM